MIFKKKLARAIVRGAKSQTRQPVKRIPADDNSGATVEAPCRYKPGNDYALQLGKGRPAEPGIRLRVLDVRRELLGEITFEDARAEGFKTREEFIAHWRELYGTFDETQPVWVLTFAPTQEERYLPNRVGSGEPSGKTGTTDYVHSAATAVKDGGEAVPEAYQELLTEEANERWDRHMEETRGDELAAQRTRRLGVKLAKLQREAMNLGVDIAPALEGAIQDAQARILDERAERRNAA